MSLTQALQIAEKVHASQFLRNGQTPYISHPLAVCSLVLRYGGDIHQAQAALLHDTISDPQITFDQIRASFGEETARLTFAFQDPPIAANSTPDWGQQKKYYLNKIRELDAQVALVVGCEEFHELTELLLEIKTNSPHVWAQYPTHPMNLAWYYKEIFQIIYRKIPENTPARKLVPEYASALKELQGIVFESAGV